MLEHGIFVGRTAVVTGGSRGIGAAIASALAAQGAAVVVTGRDAHALEAVVAAIRRDGGRAESVVADLTDVAAVRALRTSTEAAFGRPDLLVLSAGGSGVPIPLLEEDVEHWRQAIDTNLTSAFITLKIFLPAMYEGGAGAVVTIASSAGRQLSGASASYAAAKAGLLTLTRQAALEAAPHGLRVNAIAPSAIVTERLAAVPSAEREKIAQYFPLKRLGTVDDVTAATLFLLSDAAGWITGATLDIAGGRVML
jgi:3-oxoacyl-[acyl-carrier protein] reductase